MSEFPTSRVEWAVNQLERGEAVNLHSREEYLQVSKLAEKRGVPFRTSGNHPKNAHLVPEDDNE